jgi:nucleolar protein 12
VADADNADKTARTVFVGNLDAATKPKKLKQLFTPCGAVESVRLRSVAVDPEAKLPRRAAVLTGARNNAREAVNGYVVFAAAASLPAALALNMRVVDGRHIRVDALRGGTAGAAAGAAPGRLGGGAAALLATQLDHRRSVYLGNLHYAIDDEEVIAAFSKGGSSRPLLVEGCVEAVRIPRDRDTGRSKGFGYVLFRDGAAVSDALSLAGVNIHGRPVRVARASAKRAVLAATTKAAEADARAAVAGVPRTRAATADADAEGDAGAPAAALGDDGAPKMARWKVRALRAAAAGDAAAAAVLQGAAAAAAGGATGAAAGPRRPSPWEGVHATPAARPASAGAGAPGADGTTKAAKVRTKPRWRDLGRDVGTPLAQYASPLAMLKPPGASRPGGGGSAPAAKPKGRKAGAKLGVGKDGGTKRISGRKRPAVAARKSALARKKATGG